MFDPSENYTPLKDLYSYLREKSEYVIVENVQGKLEYAGLQEQTAPESLIFPATSKDEDGEETSDSVSCRPSSPESSIGGCPSKSSEDASEAEVVREEVLADMKTASDSQFVTKQDNSREEETQRSGVIGRRVRAYSDTTYLNSVRKKSAEQILRKCRRYTSFPHISTLNTSPPRDTEQTFAHSTRTEISHTQPHDLSTVSVLEISERLGKDEVFSIGSEDPAVAENMPTPKEELVKTWSREKTRGRSLSEPDPPYWEPEFQRNASSRRMSDPDRLQLVESFDRVLARPSRIPLQKKLERLVEETPLEGDSGELAGACSRSTSSVPELAESDQKLRHRQDTPDQQETGEEVVDRWTNSALSHTVIDDVTISAVSQGSFSDNEIQFMNDIGSNGGWKFEHADHFPNSVSQDTNSEEQVNCPREGDSFTRHSIEERNVAPFVYGLVGPEPNKRADEFSSSEAFKTPVVADSAHNNPTTEDTKRLVQRGVGEEESGTRAVRCYPLHLAAGHVVSVSRSPDIERIFEAEEVKRRLRDDLSSEKTTVRLLEREAGDLRREIHRREEEMKALRVDVYRRQNLLDEVLTQEKQNSALVSGLQEMFDCRRRTQDNDLQQLQTKVGELQESQFGQVKRQLETLREHDQQFREITEWFVKMDSKLSLIDEAVHQLKLKTVSQEHKSVDKPGYEQEICLLQTKLKNLEKDRVLLEDTNKRLMQEVLSLRVIAKREENSSICEARVECKDLASENMIRLESDNNSLQKELQAVKAQLQATRRELHALQATDIDSKNILLECENRALKAELNFCRERQEKTVGWTLCAKLEETRRASEETSRILDAAGDQEDADIQSWDTSLTELEVTDESSVCCDFTTECESDESRRRSKEHSQRIRHMNKMLRSAAEKERRLRRCRRSTALWMKQERKRSH